MCNLGLFANFNDLTATSISFLTALVKPHTEAFLTIFDISTTELKSPGLDTGNPASIISTPKLSSFSAIFNFSLVSNLQPGTCSPSLNVVSKIFTISFIKLRTSQ